MTYTLFAVIDVSTGTSVHAYVKNCDVNFYGGVGKVDFTRNPDEAKQFDSPAEALEYWKRQSTVRPLRDDGKPNRPLTVYTCEIVHLP